MDLQSKPCVRCGAVDRKGNGDCRPCAKVRKASWLERNKEALSAKPCRQCGKAERNSHGSCAPCQKVRSREWAQSNAPKVNPKIRLKKYGLTDETLKQLYDEQGGLCGICNAPLASRYDVDHDHTTGSVRGLLCRSCNLALGLLKDSEDTLSRALAYLRKKRG